MKQELQVYYASFRESVDALSTDWREVEIAYETLAEKQLRFALSVRKVYDQAKALDKKDFTREHTHLLKDKLAEIIRSDNQSILSRWNLIAAHAERFLPHVEQLPAQRDSLYVLARAAKENLPVDDWIRSGMLRPDMTVREVQALATGPTARAKSTATTDRLVNVTLSFDGDYGDVADILAGLLEEDSLIQIRSQDALRETFKSKLGKDGYGRVARKFD
jgi:hypothetical protein